MSITVTISGETATEVKRDWAELTEGKTTAPALSQTETPVQIPGSISTAQQAQAPITPPEAVPVAQTAAVPVQAVPTAQASAPAVPVQAPQPTTPSPQLATPPVAAAPAYTFEQLGVAGSALVDAGKMDALNDLLARYGCQRLRDLSPAQYGAFATEMRQLGAQI